MLTQFLLDATLVGAEWILYVLLALSVISIALMVERVIALRGTGAARLATQMEPFLEGADLAGLASALDGQVSVAARAVLEGLAAAPKGGPAVEMRIRAFLTTEATRLDRGLAFLGTVGSNAPFIGLFGTVLGIIRAFHDLSVQTAGGVSLVMTGISQALVATAVGLFVAIPAVVAFNAFQRRVTSVMAEAEAASQQLLAAIAATRRGD